MTGAGAAGTYLLDRPPAAFDPAAGVLRSEHFQVAYVTNDIDRACDLFARQLGISAFRRLEGPNAAGGHIRVELAWVGAVMYELIHAHGPGAEIFTARMPQGTEFALVHHHLGYLIQDRAQWDGLLESAAQWGWAKPSMSVNPLVETCFLAIPGFAHYHEFLLPTQAGVAFFNDVPRS